MEKSINTINVTLADSLHLQYITAWTFGANIQQNFQTDFSNVWRKLTSISASKICLSKLCVEILTDHVRGEVVLEAVPEHLARPIPASTQHHA